MFKQLFGIFKEFFARPNNFCFGALRKRWESYGAERSWAEFFCQVTALHMTHDHFAGILHKFFTTYIDIKVNLLISNVFFKFFRNIFSISDLLPQTPGPDEQSHKIGSSDRTLCSDDKLRPIATPPEPPFYMTVCFILNYELESFKNINTHSHIRNLGPSGSAKTQETRLFYYFTFHWA